MSYPQAIASGEILQAQDFFRLFTELDSSGDVYELDVSCKAFAIGPQSDIARARITYFDTQLPGNVQSFVVSVGDPFLGRIDAFASQQWPGARTPARIIVSPEDLLENGWRPSVVASNVAFQPPRLDLLCYFAPPSSVPLKRADFIQKGQLAIPPATTQTSLVYPFYRRKYASVQVTNFPALAGYSISIDGITFTTDANIPLLLPTDFRVQTTPIVVAAPIAAAATTTTIQVRSSIVGLFDYLVVTIAGPVISGDVALPIYYTILFTDEEA